MRAFGTEWTEAIEKGTSTIVALATVVPSSGGTYKFVTVAEPLYDAWMGLSKVHGVSQQLDPRTREATIGQITLTFVADGQLRDLIAGGAVLKRGRLSVSFGASSLTEGQLETLGQNFVIADYKVIEGGAIEVYAHSFNEVVEDEEVPAWVSPAPPTRVLEDDLIALSGVANVDTTTTDEANHTDISHTVIGTQNFGWETTNFPYVKIEEPDSNDTGWVWVADRHIVTTPQSKKRASRRDRMNGLAQLMYGSTYATEEGIWQLRRYDRTATAVKHIEKDEVADWNYSSAYNNPINTMLINGHGPEKRRSQYHKKQSPTAELLHRFFPAAGSATSGELDESFTSPWLHNYATLLRAGFNATATTLRVPNPKFHGFSGSWQEDGSGNEVFPPSTTQQAIHTVTAGRPAYFLLIDAHSGGAWEIVKATGQSWSTLHTSIITKRNPTGEEFWAYIDYTVERAIEVKGGGGGGIDWTTGHTDDVWVFDITLPYLLLDVLIDRLKFGFPTTMFNTHLRHANLEIGDVISYDQEKFLADGVDGSSSDTLHELTRVEVSVTAEEAYTSLALAFIRDGALPPIEPLDSEVIDDTGIVVSTPSNFLLGKIGAVIHDIYGNDADKMKVR
jgi:hypothetical protein